MRKIAYIELDTHAEIAKNFFELMKDSEHFRVDYYFSQKISRQLNIYGENIILSAASTILEQLSGKHYDAVIVGTVHRYFNVFGEICKGFPTSIIVHNLKFSELSSIQLLLNIFRKDILYRLKLWLKEDLLKASKVYQLAKHQLVLDINFSNQRRLFLPLFFTLSNQNKERNDDIHIVIPGGVSQKRRDYRYILKILKDFKPKKSHQFVFLGRAEKPELNWLKNIKDELHKNVKIIYFEEKLSSQDFDLYMHNADVLWCPIQKETTFFSNKEIYGQSKMSGNIGDAIRYGKLAVFPKDYHQNYPFIISESGDFPAEIPSSDFNFEEKYSRIFIQKQLEQLLESICKA